MSVQRFSALVEKRLRELMDITEGYPDLVESARYSLLAGGKRLRPVLHLMACELLGGQPERSLDFACAIEMVHTYSLIHDDLPAMDNDELRRGRKTNHVVFGEAAAILAGDALLTFAFHVMAENARQYPSELPRFVEAIARIGDLAGFGGMVSGQAADMQPDGGDRSAELLRYIHSHKTGALIRAAVLTGGILAGGADSELESLDRFARNFGLAFQITDDILDVTGDPRVLGKTTGKDAEAGKTTFPRVHGLVESRRLAAECVDAAVGAIDSFPGAQGLQDMARSLVGRTK